MKKLLIAACAATAFSAFAEEKSDTAAKPAEKAVEAELEEAKAPIFWGFANYGLYSGYQLYGSLLNNEPTLQGYAEANANLLFGDWDFGYLGAGVWSNTDLTPRRDYVGIGGAFNEWDFNVHWGRTFWFDDDRTWGLTYRSSFVWYYYPGQHYQRIHPATDTTMDWNHYFELANPYLIPYINVVREYRFESNLLQFGIKKPWQITDQFSLCPFIEMVWRENRYNWCFPTGACGDWSRYCDTASGIATLKVELDATYQISEHFGLFAKVAYCSIIDHHLRNNCDDVLHSDDYGENKDFAWGGIGVCVNF